MKQFLCPLILLAATLAPAQSPTHIGNPKAMIADAVWAGNTLYVSGQTPSPVTPADPAKGTPAVMGNTNAQAKSEFIKIQNILKQAGLTMGDVVYMRVNLVADPATGKMDFAGMNAAYAEFFGTKEQPNKPARVTVQVAGLAGAGIVEIEAVAYKEK
jgi:enamine deaminase RidA (YjgF/YER057c/UK114 family)